MRINIKEIPITGKQYECDFDADSLDIDDVKLLSPAHFLGKFFCSGTDVRVVSHLTVHIDSYCQRCLEPTPLHINTDFELFYRPYPASLATQVNLGPEELGTLHYRDNVIDITEAVRDTILLEIPSKCLCKEDCRGLCPQCGINLNHNTCKCQSKKKKIATHNPFKEFFKEHPIT